MLADALSRIWKTIAFGISREHSPIGKRAVLERPLSLVRAAKESGDLVEYERQLTRLLALDSTHKDTLVSLAALLFSRYNVEDAYALLVKANRLRASSIEALRLGVEVARSLGRWQYAAAWTARIVRRDGRELNDWYSLAGLQRKARHPQRAFAAVARGLRHFPDDAHLLLERGIALCEMDRHTEARIDIERAAATLPEDPIAAVALIDYLCDVGELERALILSSQIVSKRPEAMLSYLGHARVLKSGERYAESVAAYEQAARLFPDRPEPWINLSHVYTFLPDYAKALAAGQTAVSLAPDEALAHVNYSLGLLATGYLGEGWQHYQWRYRMRSGKDYPVQIVPGDDSIKLPSDLFPLDLQNRKIALIEDQGLGDELSFLRFAPLMRLRGAVLVYIPDMRIAAMIERSGAVDRVVPRHEFSPRDADIFLGPGDLPLALQVSSVEQIPPPLRLAPTSAATLKVMERLADARKLDRPLLGVTWRAGTASRKSKFLFKSISLESLAETLRDLPVEIVVLQRVPEPGEVERFSALLGRAVHDLSDLNSDLEAMLALVSELDDYISVSNTNVHLRAGTGRSARILVPVPADYRWMADGNSTPWFPGFQVYRQGTDRTWAHAFERLAADLQRQFGSHGSNKPADTGAQSCKNEFAAPHSYGDKLSASQGQQTDRAVFSRKNPSPRYKSLTKLYRQMHEEGERFLGIPPEQTFAGQSLLPQASRIKRLIDKTAARTLLDYGSGKGKQYDARNVSIPGHGLQPSVQGYWRVGKIQCYDPSYLPFSQLPAASFDGVIATDVLEHCPEDDIPWIVDEMFGLASKFVFANVACYPARKRLPSGENAHCTIKSDTWWASMLQSRAKDHPEIEWEFWIQRVDPGSGRMTEECLRSEAIAPPCGPVNI